MTVYKKAKSEFFTALSPKNHSFSLAQKRAPRKIPQNLILQSHRKPSSNLASSSERQPKCFVHSAPERRETESRRLARLRSHRISRRSLEQPETKSSEPSTSTTEQRERRRTLILSSSYGRWRVSWRE
jgi:hypothetical protein